MRTSDKTSIVLMKLIIGCFRPVPNNVLNGYREEMPIDSGFSDRRNLWRVLTCPVAVAIEGQTHLGRLTGGLQGEM